MSKFYTEVFPSLMDEQEFPSGLQTIWWNPIKQWDNIRKPQEKIAHLFSHE